MARDSASEKAEGPLYVFEHGSLELPMPPKFASKFRLLSTPKQQDAVRLDIVSFFFFRLRNTSYLPMQSDDGFILRFFRQSRSFGGGKRKRKTHLFALE